MGKDLKVALCCIAKEENNYIRDFVEYYKQLGINHITIYDNNDLGGEVFDEILSDYIESKFINIKNVKNTTSLI